MREILPGVHHWTTMHPKINYLVSSYFLSVEKILIDPFPPAGGPDTLPEKVEHIILTNRHHHRGSDVFVESCQCEVLCVEQGLHEFSHGEPIRSFRFGEILPGGIEAIEIGVICPDETALLIPREGGILACADGVIRNEDGPLGFVPDEYMGDDPESIKQGLRSAFAGVLEREFDHLLLAHGNPVIGGAREALRAFVES